MLTEKRLNDLSRIVMQSLNSDVLNSTNSVARHYTECCSSLWNICLAISDCEEAGCSRDSIRAITSCFREKAGEHSNLIERMQTWPRGYAGDFETVELIVDGTNHAEPNSLSYFFEQFGLNSAMSQQHRNKIVHQAEAIVQSIRKNKDKSRILSLASGGCLDILYASQLEELNEAEFVFNDIDRESLELSKSRTDALGLSTTFIEKDVISLLSHSEKLGKFDLIVVGGLFDYLSDKAIVFILKNSLSHLMDSGGKFLFTNIANNNPHRYWMEYLLDWRLIERDEERLFDLIERAGFSIDKVTIKKELTGLTWIVELRK